MEDLLREAKERDEAVAAAAAGATYAGEADPYRKPEPTRTTTTDTADETPPADARGGRHRDADARA